MSEINALSYISESNYHIKTAGGRTKKGDGRRLTRLSDGHWDLSVKRHTGRWERTPFSGSMRQMHETICTFMQHLVAP